MSEERNIICLWKIWEQSRLSISESIIRARRIFLDYYLFDDGWCLILTAGTVAFLKKLIHQMLLHMQGREYLSWSQARRWDWSWLANWRDKEICRRLGAHHCMDQLLSTSGDLLMYAVDGGKVMLYWELTCALRVSWLEGDVSMFVPKMWMWIWICCTKIQPSQENISSISYFTLIFSAEKKTVVLLQYHNLYLYLFTCDSNSTICIPLHLFILTSEWINLLKNDRKCTDLICT